MSTTIDDSDDDIDPDEIENASEQVSDEALGDPEVDADTANLTAWDEPVESAGGAVPKMGMEDEISPVEQLVEEGLDEADREQRIAAADPDYEP